MHDADDQERLADVRSAPPTERHGSPAFKPAHARSLAGKLRLTSLALGCSTNKELCTRFATVNPATAFVAQNAYKWLTGKAMPRVSSVYEDWAQVLGGGLSAPFIASSSFDEFAAVVCARFAISEQALAALRREADLPSAPTGLAEPVSSTDSAPGPSWRADHLLAGSYLAISPAWSRGESGRLILGATQISIDDQGGVQIRYRESLFGRLIAMTGAMVCDGRTAQCALTCSYFRRLFFLALHVPPPPANLFGGILSGAALHDHEARSVASRILFVRDHGGDDDALVARARYIGAEAALVDAELATLGYRSGAGSPSVSERLIAFLMDPSAEGQFEASPEALGSLGLMLDRIAPS